MSLARSILLGMSADTLFPLVTTAPRDRCAPRREPRSRVSPTRESPAGASILDRLRWEGGVRVVTTTGLTPGEIAELSAAAQSGPIEVRLSIPTPDRRLAGALEPGAPPPSLRFAALRAARRAGLAAGVIVAPLIPGVNDVEHDLERLLCEARAAGASFVAFRVSRPSERRCRELVRSLRDRYPRAAARYEVRRMLADRQPAEPSEAVERLLDRLAPRCGVALRTDRTGPAPSAGGSQTEFPFGP